MGLYLCVFDGDEELEGVEVGSYRDFAAFRERIASRLEEGRPGARFPILMLHSDCDGSWSPTEAASLERELVAISAQFRQHPPESWSADWQKAVAKELGLCPATLAECFIDVDGENLLERILELARLARATNRDILFQ